MILANEMEEIKDKVQQNVVENEPVVIHEPPNPNNFYDNIMSVDETKASVLMICLIASLIFGAIMYIINADISKVWADIIETFAYCVTGINVANAVANGTMGTSKFGGFIKNTFGINNDNPSSQRNNRTPQ